MGLTTSTQSEPGESILESFTKDQLLTSFRTRSLTLLRDVEVKALTSKLNITDLAPTVLTPSDLALLLQLPTETTSSHHHIHSAVKLLYGSFKVLGHFPFLQDSFASSEQLTLDDLIISSLFHTGRYRKILAANYDYLKLLFLSLALANSQTTVHPEDKRKQQVEETFAESGLEAHVVELSHRLTEEDTPERVSRLIRWSTFDVIKNYDDIDTEGLSIKASDLLLLVTLFLILNSVPKKSHYLMKKHLVKNIARWSEFEAYGLILLRYININITITTISSTEISFHEFYSGSNNSIPQFIPQTFQLIFLKGLLSYVQTQPSLGRKEGDEEEEEGEAAQEERSPHKKKNSFPKYKETRLINDASIAYLAALVKNLGSEIELSSQNLVKLYSGSESGFSVRSLELKIFKWQAPTLFVVSGKRLKTKTITTNKRYGVFNSEYPRFFRSLENTKRDWQNDNDTITYAVLVCQPWKNSNKRNFGDLNSIILSILPRMDFYKSVSTPALNGELIYFNNLGLGIGFGNSQPLNKGGVKKFLPGDVSLTVEANLEFAVFRHLVGLKSNSSTFFKGSTQPQVQHQDFEDRFLITDLEVWGVGSTKELEEQRKQWEWEEKQAEARQSVNLKNMGEERAFLEMVGLVGNHNSSGGSV